MRKVKLPDTSHEANRRATHEMRSQHYLKIKEALGKLVSANYERIAEEVGFHDRNQVSRRLPEMVALGMIYKTDIKTATTSGRSAYNYSLIGVKQSASELVDTMISNAHRPEFKQPELFTNL